MIMGNNAFKPALCWAKHLKNEQRTNCATKNQMFTEMWESCTSAVGVSRTRMFSADGLTFIDLDNPVRFLHVASSYPVPASHYLRGGTKYKYYRRKRPLRREW